jgi:biopolymer transport protein ExbD
MKRFSKSHHTTLSEINITPLLDLGFVLLVIFVITTTPLVQDKDLNLPTASMRPKDPPRKPNYVSLDRAGNLFLNMRPMDLNGLLEEVIAMRRENPDLSIILRADGELPYEHAQRVLETLKLANVFKLSLATEPRGPAVAP